jgi:hypothetical protein
MGCAHGVLGNTPNSAILPYVTACRMRLPLASLGLVRNPQPSTDVLIMHAHSLVNFGVLTTYLVLYGGMVVVT